MMAIEEGNLLISSTQSPEGERVLDQCIDNACQNRIFWITILLAIGNAADAVEILCVGYIMTELGETISPSEKEFLTAAVFMGMLVGGLLCGYLSDVIGRKPALLYSLSLNALAGMASAFSPTISFLIGCRIIAGIGIGGSVPAVFSLGAELFPSATRGRMLSIIASFWMVGAIFTALVAWVMLGEDVNGIRMMPFCDWRSFAVVCTIPAFVAAITVCLGVPESPRYLVAKGRYDDATKVLVQLSSIPLTLTGKQLNDAFASSERSEIPRSSGVVTRLSGFSSTFSILFGKSLWITTLVLMLIWFTLSFGSYGLSTWISTLFEDIGLSNAYADAFIFALANLPGNAVSIWYIDSIGRRSLLSWGMSLAALCAVGFGLGTDYAAVVVISAALFNAFSVAGWNSLDCMSVEYFPTVVRTSGMGVLAASGRMGAICAQFVNGTLERDIPVMLFITGACMLLGGLSAWLLPHDSTGISLGSSIISAPSTDAMLTSSSSSSLEETIGSGIASCEDNEESGLSDQLPRSPRSKRPFSTKQGLATGRGYKTVSTIENAFFQQRGDGEG